MSPESLPDISAIPLEVPRLREINRCRVVFDFMEGENHVHTSEEGWAVIEGSWLLFCTAEDAPCWQSWPMDKIVCVDWKAEEACDDRR